jgi:hypothetical protein
VGVCLAGLIVLGAAAYVFLTEPALTKKDLERLKMALKHTQIKKDKVRRNTFLSMVETRDRSLSRAQLEQAFDAVDDDRSGAIDRDEWGQFVGKDKFSMLAEQIENVTEVTELVDALAPLQVQTMWTLTKPVLATLEGLLPGIPKTQAFRKLKDLLRVILQAFVSYLVEPKILLPRLNGWLLEMYDILSEMRYEGFHLTAMWSSWEPFCLELKDLISIRMPELHLLNLQAPTLKWGDWFMKLKIFVGFSQCFCYFPVIFDVQWPENLLRWMNWLEFTSIDLYAVFGNVSCRLQTDFLQKFVFHMSLFPLLLVVVGVAFVLTKVVSCRKKKYTSESVRTQAATLVLFFAFTLYTGVSTRIFRLFKCREIEGSWYLTADYTVKCREGVWNGYAGIAGLCIIVYVIGLPAFQLYVLRKNRANLHRTDCDDPQRQRVVEKEFGSIYFHYTPESFYFDVVDLLRRLMLTGGLIMMGEESVAQIFLGVVVCVGWLCLLLYKRPYVVWWDNVIAIVLALHLVLTLVAGLAIKVYEATPDQNEYQRVGFDVVLTIVTVLCVCLSLGSTIVGTPWVQDAFEARRERREARRLLTVQSHGASSNVFQKKTLQNLNGRQTDAHAEKSTSQLKSVSGQGKKNNGQADKMAAFRRRSFMLEKSVELSPRSLSMEKGGVQSNKPRQQQQRSSKKKKKRRSTVLDTLDQFRGVEVEKPSKKRQSSKKKRRSTVLESLDDFRKISAGKDLQPRRHAMV